LASIGPFGDALRQCGIQVDLVGKQHGLPATFWRMRRHLRQVNPDVVHCHNLFPFLIGGLAARLSGDIPVVMTKHGALVPETGRTRRLVRAMIRRAWVVGVSPECTDLMTAWMPPRSRPARFIANGIATEPFDDLPARDMSRARIGLPSTAWIVGIVARLSFCKGHLSLLEAFARVLNQRPDAILLIVGDGPKLAEINGHIRQLGIARSVSVLGERRDIPAILAALDAFCLPSEMEGMPMTILEAMASQLPVIATTVGGMPGMIDHGRTGLLVPVRSVDDLTAALLELANDARRAREMGAAGRRKLMSTFHLGSTLAAYEQCYSEALQGRTIGMDLPELS
jgi:glycosyltransferase involved in cell wall biosynthesis